MQIQTIMKQTSRCCAVSFRVAAFRMRRTRTIGALLPTPSICRSAFTSRSLLYLRSLATATFALSSLAVHTAKYGAFGLSLSRHHLIKYGARPVIYIPVRADDWGNSRGGGTAILSSLEVSYRGLISQLAPPVVDTATRSMAPTDEPNTPEDAARHLKRILGLEVLAFIKPYDATLDEGDPNYYYAEREWRKFGNMRFEPLDVVHVVVHPEFVERARAELPGYTERICGAPLR